MQQKIMTGILCSLFLMGCSEEKKEEQKSEPHQSEHEQEKKEEQEKIIEELRKANEERETRKKR